MRCPECHRLEQRVAANCHQCGYLFVFTQHNDPITDFALRRVIQRYSDNGLQAFTINQLALELCRYRKNSQRQDAAQGSKLSFLSSFFYHGVLGITLLASMCILLLLVYPPATEFMQRWELETIAVGTSSELPTIVCGIWLWLILLSTWCVFRARMAGKQVQNRFVALLKFLYERAGDIALLIALLVLPMLGMKNYIQQLDLGEQFILHYEEIIQYCQLVMFWSACTVVGLHVPVTAALLIRSSTEVDPAENRFGFHEATALIRRYHQIHPIAMLAEGSILRRPRDKASLLGTEDLVFEKILLVERNDLVDMLVRNGLHRFSKAAILSLDGYPANLYDLSLARKRERRDLPVFLLHDASLTSFDTAVRLAATWRPRVLGVSRSSLKCCPHQLPWLPMAEEIPSKTIVWQMWREPVLEKYWLPVDYLDPQSLLKMVSIALESGELILVAPLALNDPGKGLQLESDGT